MKWLQELIAHLPTFSSSASHPGEPGHSLRQPVQFPACLLGILGLERGRTFLRGGRQPLFSYTPTSGDETPALSHSCEVQAFPQSYPSRQWKVHYWMVLWGSPPALPWGHSPGHLPQFLSARPHPIPFFLPGFLPRG